ncbi:MAG: NERD domain-containing protein [Phage 5P_2]|nr:MAG: NERD domain-containing protein [Phage 5P_2]
MLEQVPARIVKQNREIKELFRAKIQEKVKREREKMRERIEEEVPSWIRWAVKPLAEWRFNAVRARDKAKGEGGEDNAFLHFWLLLPNSWVVVNDAVLEPEPDEFVQIDHVLIGPPGMFLVETKAWEGAFLGYKDNWKRKEGNAWVRCESPTKQNARHARLFAKWLRAAWIPLPRPRRN